MSRAYAQPEEPDFIGADGISFEEQFEADKGQRDARRLVGDLLGAFVSLREYAWQRTGKVLTAHVSAESPHLTPEKAEKKARRTLDTAFSVFAAGIEAANKYDIKSLRLRFSLAASEAERYRRRYPFPSHLSAEERRKLFDSWARSWRSAWDCADLVQSALGFPLMTKESAPFDPHNPNREHKAATYHVFATDLIISIRKAVRAQRASVTRMDSALEREVMAFEKLMRHECDEEARKRCALPHPYAPDWRPARPERAEAQEAEGEEAEEDSPTVRLEKIAERAGKKCAALIADRPDDEVDAAGLLLCERIADEWEKMTGRVLPFPVRPPCVRGAEQNKTDAGADPTSCARASAEIFDFPAKTVETASPLAEKFSAQSPAVEVLEFEPDEEPRGLSQADADAALTACRSVGIERVKVVFIDDTKPKGSRDACTLAVELTAEQLQGRLPEFLDRNARSGVESFTVRLRDKEDTRLLQLDDCPREVRDALDPLAFLSHATSPGNFQVWLCLADNPSRDEYTEIRWRLLNGPLKATGANGGAYGSTRWPGSRNNKPKRRYADGEAPRVALAHVALNRRVTLEELERAELLAAPRPQPTQADVRAIKTRLVDRNDWPDMNYYLSTCDGDRSRAESKWCVRALGMGHSTSEVEAELEQIGQKASVRRRDSYVRETVNAAASYLGLGLGVRPTPISQAPKPSSETVRGTL